MVESSRAPVRLVATGLFAWALLCAALGAAYYDGRLIWPWAAWAVAALTLGLGIWALASGRWVPALFGTLYSLAIASVLVGALADTELHVATGLLNLSVLSVGAAILHRLGSATRAQ